MSNFKIFKGTLPTPLLGTLSASIDGNQTPSLNELYAHLKLALHLPDYFGNNLDALSDVLCDLSWVKEHKVDIVITNYSGFLAKETTHTRQDVLKILNDAADEWKKAKGKNKLSFQLHLEANPLFDADIKTALD